MGLSSAMRTALTGMTAAETTIDVVGNNLANANTVGFKSSQASFATQFLQTQSLGSAPTANSGGTNPSQIGLGTMVADISPRFTQGTIQISSSPTDFAIQGDGFFIVRTLTGEQCYTRNGVFNLNSYNELTTSTGDRVLGYGVNSSFQLQTSELVPITIPIGAATAAKATENIFLDGTLSSQGTVADAATIIQTNTLFNGNYTAPASKPSWTQVSGDLSGSYSYYITYYNSSTDLESRPGDPIGPVSVSNGSVKFTGFPVPDSSEGWDKIRLYRNAPGTSAGSNRYFQVTELDTGAGAAYTDDTADADLYSSETVHTKEIDSVGPKIGESTHLLDLVHADGTPYFSGPGDLHFSAEKDGSSIYGKDKNDNDIYKNFSVTDTTTVLDFMNFVTAATGIQKGTGIPDSLDLVHKANPPIPPGGQVTNDNRIQFTSNNGAANAVTISLTDLKFVPDSGSSGTVNMPFSTYQVAEGNSVSTNCLIYDSLGIPINANFTAVMESRDTTATTYRWFADSRDNYLPDGSPNIAVGTGLIKFDGNGNIISTTNNNIAVYRAGYPSTSPLVCNMDFTKLSGLAMSTSSWKVSNQDGFAPGTLTNFTVDDNGLVRGVFSNSVTQDLGQLRLTRFSNPSGLEQKGQNLFGQGANSGLPLEGNPGERGLGTVVSGAVELSNADIGSNLIELITASTMYRSNTRTITTVQQMMEQLLTLQR
jgi:flagellar hook-basal body protein